MGLRNVNRDALGQYSWDGGESFLSFNTPRQLPSMPGYFTQNKGLLDNYEDVMNGI
jgi:hypothetical protein